MFPADQMKLSILLTSFCCANANNTHSCAAGKLSNRNNLINLVSFKLCLKIYFIDICTDSIINSHTFTLLGPGSKYSTGQPNKELVFKYNPEAKLQWKLSFIITVFSQGLFASNIFVCNRRHMRWRCLKTEALIFSESNSIRRYSLS